MLAHARSTLQRWSELEEDLLTIVVDRKRDAVDVGAYAGTYTVRLAKLARSVYAFEPDEQMAAMLRRASYANVYVSSEAVADCEGTSEFHVPSPKGAGVASIGSLVVPEGTEYEVKRVTTTTLDTAVPNADVGFLKIDVEGAEQSVLIGARQLIARCQPVILAEANNPEAVATVSAFFETLDYAGFFVYQGTTLGLHQYTIDMQDPSQWKPSMPRREMCFVNNFFFAPRDAEKWLRTEIDSFLAAQSTC
jgi:FkbM family methyltransferase